MGVLYRRAPKVTSICFWVGMSRKGGITALFVGVEAQVLYGRAPACVRWG